MPKGLSKLKLFYSHFQRWLHLRDKRLTGAGIRCEGVGATAGTSRLPDKINWQ